MVHDFPNLCSSFNWQFKIPDIKRSHYCFPNLLIRIFDVSGVGVKEFLFVLTLNELSSSFKPAKAFVYDLLCFPYP